MKREDDTKKPTSKIVKYGGGFLIAMIGVGLASGILKPTGQSASVSPVAAPVLALVSSRGHDSDGGAYWIVEGQVKNISDESIKSVTAITTWYTKDDQFISTDQALIDFDPILPGQTSPFKTISRGNPSMSKYSVEFKRLLGGTLNTRDDRKK